MDARVDRSRPSALEAILARERIIVLAALAIIVVVSGLAMIRAGDALMMGGQGSLAYAALIFVMWWTMMMAMMLPSAAPAILTFGAINRRLRGSGSVGEFALGYAAVWTLFSLAATLIHLGFERLVPMTGMMAVTSRGVGAALLIAAGIYQFTPLKAVCLKKCQTPLFFFARNWRSGHLAPLRMGIHHGLYCLGCCWVLMAVLFYGGVMELDWILALALYVLAEKLIPPRWPLRQMSGLILVGWGLGHFATII
jgi:predicted metal-binding membrane protein